MIFMRFAHSSFFLLLAGRDDSSFIISLNSAGGSSDFSVFTRSDSDNSSMDSAGNAVSELNVDLGDLEVFVD